MSTTTEAATIGVTINRFRPIGGLFPINATLALQSGGSPYVTKVGEVISIAFPTGTTPVPITLTFTLTDPNHVLLGAALAESGVNMSVGRTEFPTVNVARDAATNTSTLVVTDECSVNYEKKLFDYLLLVQSLYRGDIGMIDPGIEDETNPP